MGKEQVMSSVEVGQLYEAKGNYRFKVLCIDDDCCFIKWLDEDNTHGVLSVEAVRENCKPFTQTDCPWK